MSHSRPPPYGALRSPLPVNRQDWGGDFRDGFLGNVERLLGGTQWLKMGPEMNGRGIARGVARGSGAAAQKNRITLTEHIQEYEVRMERIAKESYPQVELLKQVKGVGTQIALTYVLTLDDPHRLPKSREVGCFLGLRPGRRDVV